MNRLIDWLAGTGPLFYLLPWFMVLTILGTIAQRYIGLVDAQSLFFSSTILWLGPIPTPGGLTTLSLITVSLALKLALRTKWRWQSQGGIITTHLAMLLLLIGGGVTWLQSQEGYISIVEGESTKAMQDYYRRELVLWRDKTPIAHWPEEQLSKGATLILPELNTTLMIDDFCSHCEAVSPGDLPDNSKGLSRELRLVTANAPKEKEENKAGLTFTLQGEDEQLAGTYIATELLPSQMPSFEIDGHEYILELTRERTTLPFTLKLKEFEKIRYPGSSEAKEYQSLVIVNSEESDAMEYLIAMNEPLRIDGYTLYQSSFIRYPDGAEASVLTVVKNDAWLMPYLATFLLAVGLLWHMLIRYQRKKRASE